MSEWRNRSTPPLLNQPEQFGCLLLLCEQGAATLLSWQQRHVPSLPAPAHPMGECPGLFSLSFTLPLQKNSWKGELFVHDKKHRPEDTSSFQLCLKFSSVLNFSSALRDFCITERQQLDCFIICVLRRMGERALFSLYQLDGNTEKCGQWVVSLFSQQHACISSCQGPEQPDNFPFSACNDCSWDHGSAGKQHGTSL